LRVLVDGRQANVSSSDLSDASLDALAERAVAMAKLAPRDPYCGLADKKLLAQSAPELDIFDPRPVDAQSLLARALEIESAARGIKGILQTEGASAFAASGCSYFITTDGFSKGWRSSRHGQSVSAFASDGNSMERDYDFTSARWLDDCRDVQAIGETASKRALARLGATKLPSQSMPVIFDKRVSAALLGSFISAIAGPTIARGVSFLKDAHGEQIFNAAISITDDPLIKRGLGSRPWDGEGVKTASTPLVSGGVLNTWLLNTASARQLKLATSGHAERDISGPPGVSTSNSYIHAGDTAPLDLQKQIGTGLLVSEMFGPSVNINTGDYSVGIAGFAIKNGELAHPVSEVTVAGNLLDMFKTMIAANDLVFDDAMCAPSLLIPALVIAGE